MGAIVACFGLLTGIIVMFLASRMKDEIGIQSITILGVLIFLFSFPLSPLIVKLIMLAIVVFTWPYLSDRLSASVYRQLKK